MNNTVKRGIVAGVFVAAVGAAQTVRTDNANPPTDSRHSIQAPIGGSSTLAAVLNRSCGDCHSNTIASGWYTRVPPFSTLMARGASEGRKAMNFSEWTGYSPEQQRALLLASCVDAKLGKMPMKTYLRFRRDAQLSTQDVETICSALQQVDSAPSERGTPQSRKEP